MDAHDDFVSEDVNVPLSDGHWLGKHIVAGSNEVNVHDLVVSHNAEHSLVVTGSLLREELNDDSSLRVGLDGSLSLREGKNVGFVTVELESGGLVAVIADVQKTVCN